MWHSAAVPTLHSFTSHNESLQCRHRVHKSRMWMVNKVNRVELDCRRILLSCSCIIRCLHCAFPWGLGEMKAHITGRHWSCKVIRGSGWVKLADFTEGSSFLKAMPLVIPPPTHTPPISPLRLTAGIYFNSLCPLPRKTFWQVVLWTAQIHHFFLLRSQKYSFLSCWLCTFWTVTAVVERHQSRNAPRDR